MPHTRDFLTVVRGPTPTPLGLAWVENGLAHGEGAQISSAQPKLQILSRGKACFRGRRSNPRDVRFGDLREGGQRRGT